MAIRDELFVIESFDSLVVLLLKNKNQILTAKRRG
jgi:hypothetical protein